MSTRSFYGDRMRCQVLSNSVSTQCKLQNKYYQLQYYALRCDSTRLKLGFCSDPISTRPCKILAQSTTSQRTTNHATNSPQLLLLTYSIVSVHYQLTIIALTMSLLLFFRAFTALPRLTLACDMTSSMSLVSTPVSSTCVIEILHQIIEWFQ